MDEESCDRFALPNGYQLNEYCIRRVLGQGGFGITYLAHDEHLDRDVAIKEFLPSDLAIRELDSTVVPRSIAARQDYKGGLERFLKEARTLAKFDHPNIVRIFTSFERNGTAYIVMSYEAGEGLGNWLRAEGLPLPFERLLTIAEPLLAGLAIVHEAGFWHRDIKPSNIFLRADGTPVLLDFGTARPAIGSISRSTERILTPHYAPYEQYIVRGDQGPWTDIYAMGAVLYFCISGREPPEATERVHAEAEKQTDPLKPATLVGQGRYPEPFLHAIDQCLAVWPKDRLRSVADLRQALIETRPDNRSPNLPPAATLPPHWPVMVLGGGALLVAIAIAILVLRQPGGLVVPPPPVKEDSQMEAKVEMAAAREAIQVSTMYGEEIHRRSRLQDALPSSERLAQTDTRYQKQLDDVHAKLDSLDKDTAALLRHYDGLVDELAKHPDWFERIKADLSTLELSEAGHVARQRLIEHVEATERGQADPSQLQASLDHAYSAPELW